LKVKLKNRLLRDANRATGKPCSGVAGWLGLEIIDAGVDDDTATNDRRRTAKRKLRVYPFKMSLAIRTRFEVAKIADVALGIGRGTVRLSRRVEVATSRSAILGAAIAKFVDVKAMLSGCQTGDIGNDPDLASDPCEGDKTTHLTILGRIEDRHGTRGLSLGIDTII
jgi:hypothetical protein